MFCSRCMFFPGWTCVFDGSLLCSGQLLRTNLQADVPEHFIFRSNNMADDYQKGVNKIAKELEILNHQIKQLEQEIKRSENTPYPSALEKSKTIRFYPVLKDDKD